jgi:hypothetical protein
VTAKITESPPEGIVAQVLTPATIEIPLGSVPPGAYFVEIWVRRDPAGSHEPLHALVINAR